MTRRDDLDDFPVLDPDADSTLILFVGRKGSGKSTAAREVYRSWPHDKLTIDVNGDAEPGDDAERIRVPLPARFPGPSSSLVDDKPRNLHYRADPGSATYRDDLDRALAMALYPQDRPVLVWVDEIGEVSRVGQTGPHLRRMLMQSRHHRSSALMCGPRPMNIDPMCIGQADLIYVYDVPNPRDRLRLAENMGYPAARLAKELDETRRRGPYWYMLWDAKAARLWRCPPMPVSDTRARPEADRDTAA
jgi:hypothetical protein